VPEHDVALEHTDAEIRIRPRTDCERDHIADTSSSTDTASSSVHEAEAREQNRLQVMQRMHTHMPSMLHNHM
jgi:hypothetical protein